MSKGAADQSVVVEMRSFHQFLVSVSPPKTPCFGGMGPVGVSTECIDTFAVLQSVSFHSIYYSLISPLSRDLRHAKGGYIASNILLAK